MRIAKSRLKELMSMYGYEVAGTNIPDHIKNDKKELQGVLEILHFDRGLVNAINEFIEESEETWEAKVAIIISTMSAEIGRVLQEVDKKNATYSDKLLEKMKEVIEYGRQLEETT